MLLVTGGATDPLAELGVIEIAPGTRLDTVADGFPLMRRSRLRAMLIDAPSRAER